MKKIIIYGLLLICASSYSQKQLSPQAANELVNKAALFLGYEKNEKVRLALNKYVGTYNRAGASAAMGTLRNDLKGREDLLMILNRATSNRESMIMTLNAINVSPKNVLEITDYFFQSGASNPAAVNQPTVKDTSVQQGQPVQEARPPVVQQAPSKKFFDGRKVFCDGAGKWYYTVTIIKSTVILVKYPGQPNVRSESVLTRKAILNGEDMVSIDNYPDNYKYENNILYEKGEQPDQWDKYVECKE